MLNILFMAGNYKDHVCLDIFYYLEQAISKIANCKWAGPRYAEFKPNEIIEHTVQRVMPNADWVIYFKFVTARRSMPLYIPPRKQRKYRVAVYVSDLHRRIGGNIAHLNNYGWDAALMAYTLVAYSGGEGGVMVNPLIYRNNLKIPYFHMAPSVSSQVFKPLEGEKEWDVTFLGAKYKSHYPLREKIWNGLPKLAKDEKWKTLMMGHPPGRSLDRRKSRLMKSGYFVGEKYAEALARSKIFIFGTSKYKYPLMKFSEAMACRTCVFADVPLGAEEVHFIPDWNFVAIDKRNWGEKLKYYMKHDDEREEIAQRGYETFLKYHTVEKRAQQMVKFLERYR